jgi:TnpA family transposase
MARRHLLKPDEQVALFDVPTDEESLIRQYTLSGEDLKFALSKRGQRNQLGFAVQLCLIASSFLISWENRVNTQSAVIFGFSCSHTL